MGIGALGTVPKGLVRDLEDLEIEGQIEISRTTALLRSVKVLRRVQVTWEDFLSIELRWKKALMREARKNYNDNIS